MRSLNIAHRGFSGLYTENTMQAFKKAYEAGADGIELDVRLSEDGKVVIFHDAKLNRMTGEKGTIHEHKLEELERYPLISNSLPNETDHDYIPTLTEYLKWAKDKPIITNIELKSIKKNYQLELRVAEIIQTYKVGEQVIISSFLENSLNRMKILAPRIKTGLLLSNYDENAIKVAKDMDLDYVHLKANNLTEEIIRAANEHGIGINTWTVNGQKDLEKVNTLGLHGIITDYPDRLRSIQYPEQ
ncbi:glycerophosphodiester phosphodiesterase [Alkalibacterium kapii]|uniref:Glycerophosphoryl diester phosphodiesterase n=1 Tax=Alkalibacterium kapii TaxID=426704 RepID=A0A511AVH0_9LACT|nr:glycerophosphodiester phosphodiesterase family protein [Alkalibacterium kapii]GEK91111.1 glycerophosphoryl diester phosphodiesterase [Alkalibacterium kapii]